MGSGKIFLPPPAAIRRVYKLLPAGHAISNFAFSRVKASKMLEVNDPYEFLPFHNNE